jgi:UDP-2,3-diacylglucosamine pyrophosphatase LpxH
MWMVEEEAPPAGDKRSVDIVVISDVHLGTFDCHAKELFEYLDSIQPKILILNGDIIDFWAGKKWTWRQTHTLVIKKILEMATSGAIVYYVIGNHDEGLRKLPSIGLGNLKLCNELTLELAEHKVWFIHGDLFDLVVLHAKWLSKLGSFWYNLLILCNGLVNSLLVSMGKERISLAHRVKSSVKLAVKYISDFEHAAAEMAVSKGYSHIVCGHIHQPEIKRLTLRATEVVYLNSGDWVENLSALEYHNSKWSIFRYDHAHVRSTSAVLSSITS